MNDRPFEQVAGGAAPFAGGGPAADWLREAAPAWAQAPVAGPGAGPQWPRYDLAEPPRGRLNATGAAPWVAAGLLCAFLIVNRAPAPPPAVAPTPVAAGLPSPAACAPVTP